MRKILLISAAIILGIAACTTTSDETVTDTREKRDVVEEQVLHPFTGKVNVTCTGACANIGNVRLKAEPDIYTDYKALPATFNLPAQTKTIQLESNSNSGSVGLPCEGIRNFYPLSVDRTTGNATVSITCY